MANITAADVNKLRQITGSGMMDCKNALVEAEGDFEVAIDILRKKGQKVANKRSDREASQGIVIAGTADDKSFGALILLSCETDFVAKNSEFSDIAKSILNLAITRKPKTLDELKELPLNGITVAETVTNMMGKTGEKMELVVYEYIDTPRVFAYNHLGNKLASILGLNKGGDAFDQLGHELNMQVAAMGAIALDKEDVDPKVVEREIEIGKEQARQEGKPEDMLEKIAMGKLNKFYKESTLLNQDFVRDNKVIVRDYIAKHDKDLQVVTFKRHMIGA
ncbi:MAG: translation elongation factor Ts [Bacteroidales bacterium]